jgi:hypothetical protein
MLDEKLDEHLTGHGCGRHVSANQSPSRGASRPMLAAVEVDVESEILIARPPDEVAAFACDPDNATAWYEKIESVEWRSPWPLAVGSRVAFVASFMGRRLSYTYEVKELSGERFVMATAEGPFAMETTYTWDEANGGGTKMRPRNRGEPSGFGKLAAAAMRRANRKAAMSEF